MDRPAALALALLFLSLLATPPPGRAAEPDRDESATETDAGDPAAEPRVDNWIERLRDSERAIERLGRTGQAESFRAQAPQPSSVHSTLSALPNFLVNSKIGDGFASAQVEPSVAMAGPFVLCAWNTDKFPSGGDGMTTAFNFTGGFGTWLSTPLPPVTGPLSKWIADPVVGVNPKTFTWYFSGLFAPTGMPGTSNGLAVVHGSFSPGPSGPTFTWAPPVVVRSGLVSSIIFDKDWMVVDPETGNLYVTYTSFGAGGASDSILFQRSTDGGSTWGSPVTMIGVTPALVQGSRLVVGPDGEIYVAWYHAAGPPDSMQIRKSTDHGLTFGPITTVATIFSNYGSGAPGSNLSYAPNFPSLAVDRTAGPHRGRVYLSCAAAPDYADDVLGSAGPMSEIAPSGSWLHATPFTPGMTLRGAMPVGDVDTWSFFGDLGHTYVFKIDSTSTGFGAIVQITCMDTTKTLVNSFVPTGIGGSKPNFVLFSPTDPGTYYLKLFHVSSGPGAYRLKTGMGDYPPMPGSLDQRDVVVMHSDDGTTWSTPTKVSLASIGADQVMPEIGVSVEGYVYAMWLDSTPTIGPCMPSSNIGTARSSDGGDMWMPAPWVTDATTDWNATPSDIVPNQGDYLGMCAGDMVGYVYPDGRLGDPDIFFSPLSVFGSTSCGVDSAFDAGTTHTRTWSIYNGNALFGNAYACSLSCDRNWPGMPAATSIFAGPTSGSPASLTFSVPDTAASGVVHFTFKFAQPDGPLATTCVLADTIVGVTTAVGIANPGALQLALGRVWPNPGPGMPHVSFTLPDAAPATLELFDLSGRRVWSREVGALGAGFHAIALGDDGRTLPLGLYAVRLRHGGHAVTSRVTILR